MLYRILDDHGGVIEAQLDPALLAGLEPLPENPWACFDNPPGTILLPTGLLVNTRARPRGIRNANRFMAQAAAGQIPRRAPVSVQARSDGLWLVLDGNSTTINALLSGWSRIPALAA